ncbi:MAG: hypothetical protein AB1894_12605 [Chloroflexota bacterium]
MRIFHSRYLPYWLGLAHGFSDGAVGFLLVRLAGDLPIQQAGLLALLYNLLAFGVQPAIGWLLDRTRSLRPGLVLGLGLSAAALPLAAVQPTLAVCCAGLGSAGLHAAGGGLALLSTPGKASGPGLFAAPGVLGLALGAGLASGQTPIWPALAALLAWLLLGLAWMALGQARRPSETGTDHQPVLPGISGYEWALILLVGAYSLRSAVWTTFQLFLEGVSPAIPLVSAAAAVGKLLGGLLADRIGWRRWGVTTLALAALLLSAGAVDLEWGPSTWLLLAGVTLLQSSLPVMLAWLGQALPRHPATAASLGLGLATLLGGLPLLAGFVPGFSQPLLALLATLLAALALWIAAKAPPFQPRAQAML